MIPYNHLQDHLSQVSRSFSFCIEQLDEPLRRYVAVSYLLCRILDTVEDAPWDGRESQFSRFQEFSRFLRGDFSQIAGWSKFFPAGISSGEQRLIEDCEVIFTELRNFPPEVRGTITEMVESMASGMSEFANRRRNGRLHLENLREVNQYCFFVAGLVGEVLTRLTHMVEPKIGISQSTILNAHHFGLFLQKVNLLKDQPADETEGRFLIPDRQMVKRSIVVNARGALDYLLALPLHMRSYRLFCAWSLFLGLSTLTKSEEGYRFGRVSKLARENTKILLEQIASLLDKEDDLRKHFEDFFSEWPEAVTRDFEGKPLLPNWIRGAYSGLLKDGGLGRLGVV